MPDPINRPLLLLAQLLALWPVWYWLWLRIPAYGDLAGSAVALATALLFVWRRPPVQPLPRPLLAPMLILLLYALLYHQLPPLLQAALALLALSCTLSSLWLGCRLHLPLIGLLLLALPLIPSLQFYLGYPLRRLVTLVSAAVLQLNGYVVIAQGNALVWGGTTIYVDAPCSGVKMLWSSGYLLFTLSCLYELSYARLLIAAFLALIAAFWGNVLRATGLFYVEIGVIANFYWLHTAIGVAAFGLTAIMILISVRWLHHCCPARKES